MHRNKSKRRTRVSGGFTLVELLTVALIMEFLLAVAIPAYFTEADTTKITVANTNARAILGTIQAGFIRSGATNYLDVITPGGTLAPGYSASILEDLGGQVPVNPCSGGSTMGTDYVVTDGATSGVKGFILQAAQGNCLQVPTPYQLGTP